jgi:hypothetical protein
MDAYAQTEHTPLYIDPSYHVDHTISPNAIFWVIVFMFFALIFVVIVHAIQFIWLSAVRGVRLGIEVYVAGWLLSFTQFGRSFFRRK